MRRFYLVLLLLLLGSSPTYATLTRTARGTGGNNVSATTLAITPGSNFTANSFGVLCLAADNAASNGASAMAPTSVTDSVGNVWTRQKDGVFDNGAASAGVEVAIYTAPIATFTTSNNVTLTWLAGVSATAKAWTLDEFTYTGSGVNYVTGGFMDSPSVGGTTGTPSATTTSINSGDAVIGVGGAESADTWTGDSDSSNGSWSTQQHTAFGTGTTGMSVTSQTKIVTATATQTYNPTLTSVDVMLTWIQITEVTGMGRRMIRM